METKTKSQKGFTLVELIMAITAGTIVVLAAGMVVLLGQSSWNDAWKKVNLQRDASYAMLRMTRSVQAAADANVPSAFGGRALYIPNQSNPSIIYSYVQATSNLQCQVGGQSETLINGKVGNLQFDVNDVSNTVTINLILVDDNVQTNFVSTVMMRNSGG